MRSLISKPSSLNISDFKCIKLFGCIGQFYSRLMAAKSELGKHKMYKDSEEGRTIIGTKIQKMVNICKYMLKFCKYI